MFTDELDALLFFFTSHSEDNLLLDRFTCQLNRRLLARDLIVSHVDDDDCA